MNKKYKDIIFSHLMKTPSDTRIFTSGESRAFELGFAACYYQLRLDLNGSIEILESLETECLDADSHEENEEVCQICHSQVMREDLIRRLKEIGVE